MPVVVRAEHYERWLDPDVRDIEKITQVFEPFPAEEMYCYLVSSKVNNAKNDGADLILRNP
jgi:putative SOS response-associated peptidase YedK